MEIATESPRRRSSASSSPEFEFWMMRNPPSSDPHPPLLTADELFANGVLLPLRILPPAPMSHSAPSIPPPPPAPATLPEDPPAPPPPLKKWRDIFKPGEKKPTDKKERRSPTTVTTNTPTTTAAELNIHLWPFSRSRSAGTGRPRPAAVAGRKTSSAPCSRSNSRGESSKPTTAAGVAGSAAAAAAAAVRKWVPKPGRSGGIHLGRANPVWQLRRRSGVETLFGGRKDTNSAGVGKVLNLNVNTCIGHRSPASCRDFEKDAESTAGNRSGGDRRDGEGGAGDAPNGSLFNLRAIFTKKVY